MERAYASECRIEFRKTRLLNLQFYIFYFEVHLRVKNISTLFKVGCKVETSVIDRREHIF
jgi:hypothetical protein